MLWTVFSADADVTECNNWGGQRQGYISEMKSKDYVEYLRINGMWDLCMMQFI